MHLGDFLKRPPMKVCQYMNRDEEAFEWKEKETGRVESGCEGRGESKMLYSGVIT